MFLNLLSGCTFFVKTHSGNGTERKFADRITSTISPMKRYSSTFHPGGSPCSRCTDSSLTLPADMKKVLPILFATILASVSFAQNCVRDSSILQTGALLSPPYWDTVGRKYALADACINNPYNQFITVNVPLAFQNIPLSSVTIATSGAVSNLPVGLTYSCDPPNCVFAAGSLGCIRMFGTPTAANTAPDTLDLGLTVTVNTLLGGIPLIFPSQLPGNNHYYLALKDEQCLVGTFDPNSDLGFVKASPNPFSSETVITVESLIPGEFNFEVFNILGKRVHAREVRMAVGENQIVFDGSELPSGSYFYSIGNVNGRISRPIVISH